MAIYRSPVTEADTSLPRRLGEQLGLHRLDANWLADDDGISPITVRKGDGPAAGFIPYTDRAIQWHTDGYYQSPDRAIRGMILHCVRAAASGGENRLLDPELAYIALRDTDPAFVRALMADDAMTIPARTDEDGIARAAQGGPVFSVAAGGALTMRYTARTRSIEWRDDPTTRAAVACLRDLLAGGLPRVLRVRLDAGMGLVSNNVLHDRIGLCRRSAAPAPAVPGALPRPNRRLSMSHGVTVWRAAHLVGVPRSVLQQRVRQGELELSDGPDRHRRPAAAVSADAAGGIGPARARRADQGRGLRAPCARAHPAEPGGAGAAAVPAEPGTRRPAPPPAELPRAGDRAARRDRGPARRGTCRRRAAAPGHPGTRRPVACAGHRNRRPAGCDGRHAQGHVVRR